MSCTLSPHIPVSWFHPIGIKKVLKRFWHRLPDVNGSLFITLTVNPHYFDDEASAFEHARDRIRRITDRLRSGIKWEGKIFKLNAPYSVKVEFHESGWPHFHIVMLTRKFLPARLLEHIWGYGWTHVARIKQSKFEYILKYVSKSQSVPDWVKSKKRIKIFQPSKGFLKPEITKGNLKNSKSQKRAKKQSLQNTIGERLDKWERMARFTDEEGNINTFEFPCPFKEIFDHLIFEIALDGRYLGNQKTEINNTKQVKIWAKTAKQICSPLGSTSLDSSSHKRRDSVERKMDRNPS